MKPVDLAGKKEYMLTAIKRVDSLNGRSRWLCKCDCGNESLVLAIISGKLKVADVFVQNLQKVII